MNYKYCSMKEVLGKVVRNTRVKDSSFLVDAHEWIPEALRILETRYTGETLYHDLEISFHRAEIPCGTLTVLGIEYGGSRLRYSDAGFSPEGLDRIAGPVRQSDSLSSAYVSIPAIETVETPANPNPGLRIHRFYSDSVQQLQNLGQSGDTYCIEGGCIQTSMREGLIRVFTRGIPTDGEGLPMIPDNESLKQAMYWWARLHMVGAGWKDTVYSPQYLENKFWEYGRAGISQINQKTPDAMEASLAYVRMLPPEGYWEGFFAEPGQEGTIGL